MGTVLQVELPVGLDEQQMPQTNSSRPVSADQQLHVSLVYQNEENR